jgi:hypothetical protein
LLTGFSFFLFLLNSWLAPTTSSTGADSLENRVETPDEDFGESTELRGTLFWAPPRPQLILKIHKKPR